MEEEQKTELKKMFGKAADELSDKALAAAKTQTNKLWKVLLYAIGIMLAGIAALAGFTGCAEVPQVTAEQVQAVHDVYHAATGETCMYRVIPVENVKK